MAGGPPSQPIDWLSREKYSPTYVKVSWLFPAHTVYLPPQWPRGKGKNECCLGGGGLGNLASLLIYQVISDRSSPS